MLKKSHRSFAIATLPLFFIPLNINYNLNLFNVQINNLINNYNLLINSFLSLNYFQDYQNILIFILSLFIYFYAATFPDYDRYLKIFYSKENQSKRYLYHRQISHSLLLCFIIIIYSLYYINNSYYLLSLFFGLGILTHLIADMITGSIPILLYGPYYIRFSRLGITIFLPKSIHKIFTEKLPKFLDKNYLKIFIPIGIINLFIALYFNKIINLNYIF